MKKNILFISFLIFGIYAFAQEKLAHSPNKNFAQKVYHFTKGLMINSSSRYGREALYSDQLAFKLYTGTMKTPAEGDSFTVSERGDTIKWLAITADSLNQLRGRRRFEDFGQGRGGGYIYLTYQSDKQQPALLNIKGNSSVFFNGILHAGDPYSSGWLYIPVLLKRGLNEVYVRGQNIIADLIFPDKPVYLNVQDSTLPYIVPGNQNNNLTGAIVLVNTSANVLRGMQVKSNIQNGKRNLKLMIEGG